MKNNQRGFGAIEGILIVVIIGVIGGVGWFVYQSKNKTTQSLDKSTQAQNEPQKTEKETEATQDNPSTQQINFVKFSSVDPALQTAITASFKKQQANCLPGTTSSETTADKDGIITHYDANSAAIVAVGCRGGSSHLFGKEGNTWVDSEATQMAFSCSNLRKYHVPASWIENNGPGSAECSTGGVTSDGSNIVKYQ